MKKLLLLLLTIFILPISIKALTPNYNVEGLYIDAYIQENGDLLIKEQIVLKGTFNGYIRDLYYKGEYPLYDASNLEILDVCELTTPENGEIVRCFDRVDFAHSGESYLYEEELGSDYTTLKMYNYNPSGQKTFYIEYLLTDVVVIHEDVAELYWTFIGENFDDKISNVRITIHLPVNTEELRGWAHGPLYGDISIDGKSGVSATVENLAANELIDIRMVFDTAIVPLGNKLSNKMALDNILVEEQQRADDANILRTQARFIHYGVVSVNIIWLVGLLLIFIYTYLKFDKEHSSRFNLEYHREFPADYGPETVEFLLKKKITTVSLSAAILNIIQKKAFMVKEVTDNKKKKDYILVNARGKDEKLTEDETYIKTWLLNEYGNGEEVKLKDITKASRTEKSARKFIREYDKWLMMVKTKAEKENFFEDNLNSKMKLSLYAVLGILLFVLTISLNIITATVPFLLIGSIIFIIYLVALSKRTKKGNDHFVKWQAFRKFLLDFGRFKEKELPEIILWEKYLVYATIFGIANKVRKVMEIKIKDMNIEQNNFPMFTYFYMHSLFASSLSSTIDTTSRMSHSTIAKTNNSSGGGFGGGFSGGGGFGGGGTGGGGRGF